MFPYLLLVGLAALATGTLNAHHRFFTAALGPVVLNLSMIGAVLLLARHFQPPIVSLAVGVLVGGLGQLLVQLPEVRRLGVPLRPSGEWTHPAVRTIARRLLPAAFGLAAVQITVVINTLLASLLPTGSVSYLYYADRVMEFPLGVFGIALATAALPTMSAQAARGDHAGLTDTLGFALRLSVFIAVPAAVGLVALGGPPPPPPPPRRSPPMRWGSPRSRRRASPPRPSTRWLTRTPPWSWASSPWPPTSSSLLASCGRSRTPGWRWPRRWPPM